MKSAEDIQKEYALNLGFECFTDLLLYSHTDIDWHVSNVQKEYARQLTSSDINHVKILSIERDTDKMVFNVGDTVRFSDRYNPFLLEQITFNPNERRIELSGDSLFCSVIESDCEVISPQTTML